MLTIRFARVGKRNKAQFKIMLQEHTVAPGGHHIEILGNYNPHSKEANLKDDRIKYWVSKGAQLSNTVHNLLVRKGVIEAAKRKVKVPAKKVEEKIEEVKEAVEVKDEEVKIEDAVAKEVKPEEVKEEEAKD